MSKLYTHTLLIGLTIISLSSCVSSGDDPGIEYAPDMYISQAYEPYSQEKSYELNPNGMTMRLPVNGTIARGQLDYIYPHPNTAEGYEASANYMPNIAPTKNVLKEGERLYNIYCWHCHGKKGENEGPVFSSGKMPPPPWPGYQADYVKQLPSGKIYHTIYYGKGLMGSHAAMLNPSERWSVIHYVKYLSLGAEFTIASGADVIEQPAPDSSVTDTVQQTN